MTDNESVKSIVEQTSGERIVLPFPLEVMDWEIRLALVRKLHAITYGYTWLLTGSDIFDSFPKDRSFAIRGENQQAMVVIYEYFKSREARSCALEIRKRSNDSSILTFHSPPDDCPDEYRLLWNEWHEGIIEHLTEGEYWKIPENAETPSPSQDEELQLSREAKRLKIKPDRLRRWKAILPIIDLTQETIAERLIVSPETIKKDISDMKKKGYLLK